MKLYHFTSHLHLPHIKKEGLCFGDIPITGAANVQQAVQLFGEDTGIWLTGDKQPRAQIWTKGNPLDKTAIRLTVEIPEEAMSRLYKWRDYADRNISDLEHLQRLEKSGGSPESVKQWFIFKGVIPPEWIVKTEELKKKTYPPSVVKRYEDYRASAQAQRLRVRE